MTSTTHGARWAGRRPCRSPLTEPARSREPRFDMDLKYYNFTINPEGLAGAAAARYVRDVHEHLRWIHRTTSGRLLLNCIRRPTFPVEIRPYPTAVCNSEGGWERKAGAAGPSGVVKYTPFAFSHAGSCAALPADQNRGRL